MFGTILSSAFQTGEALTLQELLDTVNIPYVLYKISTVKYA